MHDDSFQKQLTWKPGANIYHIEVRMRSQTRKQPQILENEILDNAFYMGQREHFGIQDKPTRIIRLIWISATEGLRKIFSAMYFGNSTVTKITH